MANFVRHIGCSHCGSSDANSLYDDNSTYCFACNKASNENKGEDIPMEPQEIKAFYKKPTELFTKTVRGISPSTYHKYSYNKAEDGSHIIDHYNTDGQIVAQKSRYKDKTFSWSGNAKQATPFGLHLFKSGEKRNKDFTTRITITEGELDCLSVAEATNCKYPVISINNGAQAAAKDLKQHIEFLDSFDEIVLWFDNDEPGQKAFKEVAALFKPGKVYTINSGAYKDANEILLDKGKAEVAKYYYEYKKYSPAGLVRGSDLDFESIISIDTSASVLTPFSYLNQKIRGLRKGELITLTAGTGVGKSTFARELAYDMITAKGLKVGWVALEENNQRSALGFMGMYLNSPIYMTEEREVADKVLLREAFDAVLNNDNIHLFDDFGSFENAEIMSKIRYLAISEEVDFIFLDHISIVVSGGKEADNERVVIDRLITDLKSLTNETGVGIVIISHLRKPTGDKGFENGIEITLNHLRGSGSIAQLSDTVISLERDNQHETDSNIAKIRVLKNRYTGASGLAGNAQYNINTGRLLDYMPLVFSTTGFNNETEEDEF